MFSMLVSHFYHSYIYPLLLYHDDQQTVKSGNGVTVECILTVFEEAGMNETINIEQLTATLQEGVLSFDDPAFAVIADSVVIGGWSKVQINETNICIYTYMKCS